MRDHLEKYILANRSALDVHRPSPQLWNRIALELETPEITDNQEISEKSVSPQPSPAQSQRRQFFRWKIAAAIVITALTSAAFAWKMAVQPPRLPSVISHEENPQLHQMEAYYQTAIKAREDQIRLFQQGGLQPDESLFFQLQRLQDLYQDLRKELPESQDPEIVVNAMMQNLTMQMEILNQQLMILEQIKSMKNEKDSRL
ncbi:MAG: hypothetical protein R3C61_17270 [Bacteroidia bacterium]